ncbi:MAG: hypothetical protein WBA01_04495, partial [Phormidesmis sp.]
MNKGLSSPTDATLSSAPSLIASSKSAGIPSQALRQTLSQTHGQLVSSTVVSTDTTRSKPFISAFRLASAARLLLATILLTGAFIQLASAQDTLPTLPSESAEDSLESPSQAPPTL